MIWLYRLQQRLSITRHEGLAVLVLTTLFLTGLTVHHVQEQQVPPVALDSLVAQPIADSSTAPVAPASQTPTPSADHPIDLNTASRETLQALPGIGPALADRIDTYRTTQRPFQRVEELQRVRGIGSKTLATLRPMVRIASSTGSTTKD